MKWILRHPILFALLAGLFIAGCSLLFAILCTRPAIISALNLSGQSNLGNAIGGLTAPVIAICSAILLFLALIFQYNSNQNQNQKSAYGNELLHRVQPIARSTICSGTPARERSCAPVLSQKPGLTQLPPFSVLYDSACRPAYSGRIYIRKSTRTYRGKRIRITSLSNTGKFEIVLITLRSEVGFNDRVDYGQISPLSSESDSGSETRVS